MVYVTRFPGDDEDGLDWYAVYGTKKEAVRCAKDHVDQLSEETGDKWKTRYVSAKNSEWYGTYYGRKTIVVEQTDSLYHGA